MNKDKLTNYQIMTLTLLLNTARKIISEEGSNNLTIRNLASKSGYQSGTIYNYFENIEHLKVFAYLQYFDEYIDDLQNYVEKDASLIDNYYGIWNCFIKHTIINTEAFFNIFFNTLERSISEYIAEYYNLFPTDDMNYNDTINKMLNSSSIRNRNIILLDELCREGYLPCDKVEMINDLSAFTYESILHRIYRGNLEKEEGGKKIFTYIKYLLNSNISI